MNAGDGLQSPLNTAEATQKLREILNVGVGQPKVFEAGGVDKAPSCFNLNGNTDNTDGYSSGKRMLESLTKAALIDAQTVVLKGASESQSFDIYSQNVTVVVNSLNNHLSGSSRVRIKNIVDYGWEQKYYTGRLLATHLSGNYVAYSILARDKTTGIVRVINVKSGERTLFKINGIIKDLSFAHVCDQVILAFVDEIGNLYVHEIQDEDGKLSCASLLTITQPADVKPSDNHRVIWCQFIPEEVSEESESSEMDNCSKLLVVTHDDKAEMLNVEVIVAKHGNGPIPSNELSCGYQIITDHNQPIIDASFSPDGVALATASLDAEVKFFQVYLHEEQNSPSVHCWKFAVTGADFNREIKVWSCETWSCLQTINFTIPDGESLEPCFKAGLDLSATYLMLSDVVRKVFYILILKHDMDQNLVTVCSLTAFPLPFPILSYSVVDASRKKYKQSVDNEHIVSDLAAGNQLADDIQDDETENLIEGIVVRLFYIQPKSLQECRIAYQPNSTILFPTTSASSLSQDSFAFRDHISDMSYDTSIIPDTDSSQMDENILSRTPLLSQTNSLSNQVLLTPEAFTSSPIHGTAVTNSKSIFQSPLSAGTPSSIPLPPVTPSEEAALATPTEESAANVTDLREPDVRHSGRSSGSSPSLEVQQILAPTTNECDIASTVNNFVEISQPPAQVSSTVLTNANDSFVSLSPFNKQPSPNIREYDPTIWPLAPNLNSDLKMNSVEQSFSEVTQKIEFNETGGGEPRLDNSLNQQTQPTSERLEATLIMMQESLRGIGHMMHLQQKEIVELRQELRAKQSSDSSNQQEMGRCFSKNISKLESSISAMMERNLLQLKQCDSRWIDELMRNIEKREQQSRDRMVSGVTQTIVNTVVGKLDSCVKHEMKNVILPALSKTMDPLKEHIQAEIVQKLSTTDNLMKENISKMVKSKTVIDAIGNSAALIMQQLAPAAYRETFQSVILPSFEKACQKMFEQLNINFQQGTKEYIQHVDRHMDQRRRQQEQVRDPVLAQLQAATATFQTTTEQLTGNLISSLHSELERQLKSSILGLQDILIQRIHQHIRNEIDNAMKEQKNMIGDSVIQAIRSRAVTPIPTVDPQIKQAQIMQLARTGQFNAAFQQALSASDLSLVTLLCQAIPPDSVFGHEVCPLQQPVLLSLIQQLSSDLSQHTEVKLKYLQDALFSLDRKSPITKEHVVVVMQSLNLKLHHFIQNNPSNEQCRVAKMLLLATQSVKD
uniref:Uncharacterized protein n=1 Tax=Strigamia maritima TaxID=126957 RepID=T1IHJ6_STRMM